MAGVAVLRDLRSGSAPQRSSIEWLAITQGTHSLALWACIFRNSGLTVHEALRCGLGVPRPVQAIPSFRERQLIPGLFRTRRVSEVPPRVSCGLPSGAVGHLGYGDVLVLFLRAELVVSQLDATFRAGVWWP